MYVMYDLGRYKEHGISCLDIASMCGTETQINKNAYEFIIVPHETPKSTLYSYLYRNLG